MPSPLKNIGAVLLLVLVVVIALLIIVPSRNHLTLDAFGGDPTDTPSETYQKTVRRARVETSKHVVVDALNLTHWLMGQRDGPRGRLQVCDVVGAIDDTAACLRKAFPGQVMYVTKDRESVFNVPLVRAIYQRAAIRNGIYIYVVERYEEPPRPINKRGLSHGQLGRDDFYMGLLAWKHPCGVLTQDRMRDYEQLKKMLDPFHVYEYTFWRTLPARDQINPSASTLSQIRKPVRLGYTDYL